MDHRRTAGLTLFCGSAIFLIGLLMAETQYPGYSVATDTISQLGIGPLAASILFSASVFIFGAMGALSAWFMRKGSMDRAIWIMFLISGVGAMGVGLVNLHTPIVHGFVALLAFGGGALAAVFSYRVVKMPLGYISALLGSISVVALALFAANVDLGLGHGGMERMVLYPTIVWTIGLAAILMAGGGAPSEDVR